MRCLISCVGGDLAPLALILMKKSAVESVFLLGVDMSAEASGAAFCDAFRTVPPGRDPGYPDIILALVEEFGIELVMPGSDEEAIAMAPHVERFRARGATLLCAPAEILQRMSDKAGFYQMLADNGLPAPAFGVAENVEALGGLLERFLSRGMDAVIKPARGRGGRDVYVVDRALSEVTPYFGGRELHMPPALFRQEHMKAALAHAPLVVMERLVPPAYDVDVLAWEGESVQVVPRRRLNPAGIPCTGNVLDAAPELAAIGEGVARMLKLSWLYDVDVMTGGDGRFVPLEINPRPSGSVATAVAAGIPIYDQIFRLVRGERPEPMPVPDGRKVVTYLSAAVVGQ